MNPSSLYPRAPHLLAGFALLLSCFLLSGCESKLTEVKKMLGDDVLKYVFGEHLDQFPAVVLDANGETTVNYTFDWKRTTFAGESLIKFIPSQNYWRMNVFKFSDGKPIGKYNGFKSFTESSLTFPGVNAEELLRVDFDLADDQAGTKNRMKYSFVVLFHNDK